MALIVTLPIQMRVFLGTVVFLGPILIVVLLSLLRRMLDKQVKKQFDKWTAEAKIPKSIKGLVGLEIKWR